MIQTSTPDFKIGEVIFDCTQDIPTQDIPTQFTGFGR